MIRENDIREQLANYLRGELSLSALNEWILVSSWNMHKDSRNEARRLVAKVLAEIHEYGEGNLNEAALKGEIREMIGYTVLSFVVEDDRAFAFEPSRTASSNAILILSPPIPEEQSAAHLLIRGLSTLGQTNGAPTPLAVQLS